jgi:integrase
MKRLRKVVSDEHKTIHSLRHRMKDLLRNTDCPERIAREIMGHSDQSIAADYGAGHALKVKREALEKAWAKG